MKDTSYVLQKGFTLIEILIVIGIIAVLASIVVVAINPAKQFAQARNTQRQSNIETILNAIGQRMADNKGIFQGAVNSTITCPNVPSSTAKILYNPTTVSSGEVDLSCLVPIYISLFPTDPSVSASADTGYTVAVDTYGRVKVCAPLAAQESTVPGSTAICISR